MNKRFLMLLLAVCAFFVGTVSLADNSTNLLKNPGFEEIGEDGLPLGWFTDAYINRIGVTLYSVSDSANSGSKAAVVENLDMNDARFSQTVEVKPNAMYRLSGWINASDISDAGRGANLSIEGVYVFSESLYETDGEWVYIETYGLTDKEQTEVTVFARVGGYSGESKGMAAFDDLCLEAVSELPTGVRANAWYTIKTVQPVQEQNNSTESGIARPFWPWLIIFATLYVLAAYWLMQHLQLDRVDEALVEANHTVGKLRSIPIFVYVGLAAAMLLRLITALSVDGYQVDVNCFTAWGNTMANVGPSLFYQSNWCDYTPGYIYVMGLNGFVAKLLSGFVKPAFIHKIIPMVCDIIGACLIYRLAFENRCSRRQAGLMAVLFAFNPAAFLNSAAWCQIDSVLCLGLMMVAYLAIHRRWALVLPTYVLCILLKPQALMLGFLGLAAIIMELIRNRSDKRLWRQMAAGLLISLLLAMVIILPFGTNQKSCTWLIDLYKATLGSYPHATVNTPNLFYLAGANWDGINNLAKPWVIGFLGIFAAAWGVYTFIRRKNRALTIAEPILTMLSTLLLAAIALLYIGWEQVGEAVEMNSLASTPALQAAAQLTFSQRITLLMNHENIICGNGYSVSISGAVLMIAMVALIAGVISIACYLVKKKRFCSGLVEPALSLVFVLAFIGMLFFETTWTVLGVVSMAMAFAIVLPIYIRSGKLENLPLCGAVIFILLYVFGIKMHERYLFPALFLLAMAYASRRDRRILALLVGLTSVLFITEGTILDNSLRLGSSMGHLNADNVNMANILSAINVACAVFSAWLCHRLCLEAAPVRLTKELSQPLMPVRLHVQNPTPPSIFSLDAALGLKRIDYLLMLIVTAVYSVVTLNTLGSTKAPQNPWKSSSYDEMVCIDLGKHYDDFSMMYFCQVSYNNFSVAVSEDGAIWSEEYPAEMREGMCFSWEYLDPSYLNADGKAEFVNASQFSDVQKLSGRYIRLHPKQVGLTINELIFKDQLGNVIPNVSIEWRDNANPASPFHSEPSFLLDEQDSLDGEPSWWNSTYFDEIYHARTAFEHMNGTHAYEWTHPPLGKIIMSWFVSIFGMTPFGWRFGGALCGILMLPTMYLLVKQLTKRTDMSFVAMMLMTLDCMHFTQTRIATIDSYPVLFIMLSYFFMLRFMQRDIILEDMRKLLPDLALCGFFMGCGVACKWIGVYAGLGLAVLYFWTCFRHLRLAYQSDQLLADSAPGMLTKEEIGILTARSKKKWLTRVVHLCLWCLLFFVTVPVVIYLLTYVVHFADRHFESLGDFLKIVYNTNFGKEYSMLSYHSTPRLGMDHVFYSPWYEWPLMMTPMYYASAAFKPEGMSYAIFCFGNPWVWLVGIVGIAFVVYHWAMGHRYVIAGDNGTFHMFRDDWNIEPAFVLIGLLAQFLPWVLVPRGTYIYHYFASVPFLVLGITLLINTVCQKHPKGGRVMWILYLILCFIWFVLLFPYASGIMVSESWLDFIRDYPYITQIDQYWQNDLLVQLNDFLEKIPVFPHVYHH